MELDEAFKKLQQSREFRSWNKENKDVFASFALKMLENGKEDDWHFGFYHESTEKIATFILGNDKIEFIQEEEIFKKPDDKIIPIDFKKSKISLKKILEHTSKALKDKYPSELVNKTIAILQNVDENGTIWNITYLTNSYKTINFIVNPENIKIIRESMESLTSLIKK